MYLEQEFCRIVRVLLKSIHLLVCLPAQYSWVLIGLDHLGVLGCSLWTALSGRIF